MKKSQFEGYVDIIRGKSDAKTPGEVLDKAIAQAKRKAELALNLPPRQSEQLREVIVSEAEKAVKTYRGISEDAKACMKDVYDHD